MTQLYNYHCSWDRKYIWNLPPELKQKQCETDRDQCHYHNHKSVAPAICLPHFYSCHKIGFVSVQLCCEGGQGFCNTTRFIYAGLTGRIIKPKGNPHHYSWVWETTSSCCDKLCFHFLHQSSWRSHEIPGSMVHCSWFWWRRQCLQALDNVLNYSTKMNPKNKSDWLNCLTQDPGSILSFVDSVMLCTPQTLEKRNPRPHITLRLHHPYCITIASSLMQLCGNIMTHKNESCRM